MMLARDILRKYPISRRQLDVWTTNGYLGDDPKATGHGTKREYSAEEITLLERIIAFVQAGVAPATAAAIARGDSDAVRRITTAMEKIDDDTA